MGFMNAFKESTVGDLLTLAAMSMPFRPLFSFIRNHVSIYCNYNTFLFISANKTARVSPFGYRYNKSIKELASQFLAIVVEPRKHSDPLWELPVVYFCFFCEFLNDFI
jgi:hypothetical protein